MKRLMHASGILLAASLAAANVSEATELRGRVDSRNASTGYFFPRRGALVEVRAANGAVVGQARSGGDGMYYLSRIQPGNYVLIVNGVRFPLGVANVPSQDVPPVLVP